MGDLLTNSKAEFSLTDHRKQKGKSEKFKVWQSWRCHTEREMQAAARMPPAQSQKETRTSVNATTIKNWLCLKICIILEVDPSLLELLYKAVVLPILWFQSCETQSRESSKAHTNFWCTELWNKTWKLI